MKGFRKKLVTGLSIMALLSPLGIIVPNYFGAKYAWGEWDTEAIGRLLGYIPEGMKQGAGLWTSLAPGYQFWGDTTTWVMQMASYMLSGLFGVALVSSLMILIARWLGKNDR